MNSVKPHVKILFVVNVDWFFYSHRLPIAVGALKCGYEVHLATTFTGLREKIENHGILIHELDIDRSGGSPLRFFKNLLLLASIYKSVCPEIVHLVTLQPNILGGVLARLFGIRSVVYAISGLGHVFIDRSLRGSLRRNIIIFLYRLALGSSCKRVIFQNKHDLELMSKLAKLRNDELILIPGSGVDLKRFSFTPLPTGKPVILMASRLLSTKGVRDYILAAKIIRGRGHDVIFQLAGDPDPSNPGSITIAEIDRWRSERIVEIIGYRNDLHTLLALSSIFVLPSYLEGLPKVLCEAASTGRPVIATDVPGCRDAVEPGVTGLLVPPRNSIALANALEILLTSNQLLYSMSICGRARAEQLYNIDLIVQKHLDVYQELLSRHPRSSFK